MEISFCLMCFKKGKPIAQNLLQSCQLYFCGYSGALLRWTCHCVESSLLTELGFFYLLDIAFYNWNTFSSSFTTLTGVIRGVVTYSNRKVKTLLVGKAMNGKLPLFTMNCDCFNIHSDVYCKVLLISYYPLPVSPIFQFPILELN